MPSKRPAHAVCGRFRAGAARAAIVASATLAGGLLLLSNGSPAPGRPAVGVGLDSAPPATPARARPRRSGAARRPSARAAQERAVERLVRLGLPIYCAGGRTRDVALTFDDGPGQYTPLALRILRRAGARATFFLVGRSIAAYAGLPRKEAALGTVGDHTWNHRYLPGLPKRAMGSELARTKAAVAASSGAPVRLFRPPYGAHTPAVDRKARALGMLEVLWSVDTRDSEGADWRQISANALAGLRPGSIVLMHENRGQTIRALRRLVLPGLHRLGLRAVSVPELLAADPPTVAQVREGLPGCLRRPRA